MRVFATILCLAAACASAPARAQDAVYDPWENANRTLYGVHDDIDKAVLEPVAKGYRAVTNEPVRTGVSNFLRNLRAPVVFVNDLLQGKPKRAGAMAARFGINTTIGLLGMLDPAEDMGIARHDEDFGQTLAVWGVPSGPYIFVPVLGPTTVRDGAGRVIDLAFQPLTWAQFDGDDTVRVSRTVVGGVAARESLIEAVDDVRATSLDPYVTVRTSYGLLRQSQIRDGAAAPASDQDQQFDWSAPPPGAAGPDEAPPPPGQPDAAPLTSDSPLISQDHSPGGAP